MGRFLLRVASTILISLGIATLVASSCLVATSPALAKSPPDCAIPDDLEQSCPNPRDCPPRAGLEQVCTYVLTVQNGVPITYCACLPKRT